MIADLVLESRFVGPPVEKRAKPPPQSFHGRHGRYSNRSERAGSIRAARTTGINVATTATPSTSASAEVRINGSDGRTSYSQLDASWPVAYARPRPMTAPVA